MIKVYVKIVIYLAMFAASLYGLSAFDFNRFLKKDSRANATILYILIAIIMAYLLGEFMMSITYYFNI